MDKKLWTLKRMETLQKQLESEENEILLVIEMQETFNLYYSLIIVICLV